MDKYQKWMSKENLDPALKAELVMTGFVSDWEHFFKLRCHSTAHPQARELAVPLQNWFKEIPKFPNTFELVLMYFKEKYKWANNPHPPFSWLIKDGLNYQSVYNEWVEKEGKYILGEL